MPAAEQHVAWPDRPPDRQAGPVAPERFGVLQSLLAYLLAACGDEREAVIPAHELVERFSIPEEALEEHLSLLNLVNFGGGCYAVYAELHGDEVHVDKELFGDTFRRAPRLTPLEARAIRLALEFVGPMIAAGSSSPLDRVRAKLEEAFGQFDLAQTPTPQAGAEEDLVATLTRAIDRKRLVELEYLKPESTEVELAHDRAVRDRAAPPALVRPHLGRRPRRAAQLPARPHADGEAAHAAVRAARGLRSVRAARGDDGTHLVLARRSHAGRSRRAPSRSSTALRCRSGAVGSPDWLVGRDAVVPRRGLRDRAAGAPGARRDPGARPRAPAARGARDRRPAPRYCASQPGGRA